MERNRRQNILSCYFQIVILVLATPVSPEEECSSLTWEVEDVNGTLAVSWSASEELSGDVQLEFKNTKHDDKSCKVEAGVTTVDYSIGQVSLEHLCRNTEYELSFSFENCTVRNGTRKVWTPPGPPLNLTIEFLTNTSFWAFWNNPGGNGKIEHYLVVFKNGNSSSTEIQLSTFQGFTDLHPFSSYQVSVSAKNQDYYGEPSTVEVRTKEGIPAPPTNVSVTSVTNTSIYLEWSQSDASMGPILNYTVICSNKEMDEEWTTSDTFLNISDLKPYTFYELEVAASTSAGRGEWSEETTVRTEIGIPHPPSNLTVISKTNTSIYLKWSEPEPSTGPVLSYTVVYRMYLKTTDKSARRLNSFSESTKIFFNITTLEPYTNYWVKVAAMTVAGLGKWSNELAVQTAIGIPDPPTNVTVTSKTSTSIYLEWSPPNVSKGPIVEYMIRCTDGGTNHEWNTAAGMSLNVSNLHPFTTYELRVAAITQAGRGDWSEEITAQTDVAIPYSPSNPSVTSQTSTSLYIQWTEPKPSTGEILIYTVKCSKSDMDQEWDTPDTYLNATDLDPFTQYRLKVAARTLAGYGNWSEEIMAQTDVGIPYPPANVSVASQTSSSLYLQWSEPKPFTGPISMYTVWIWNTTKWNTTDNYFNASDLKPYTSYKIKVSAWTGAGKGDWSKEINAKTSVGIPYTPTNVTIVSKTNTSLYLKWFQPQPSTGPILNYTVRCNTVETVQEWNTSNTTLNLSNLKPYTFYTVKVAAITKAGKGEWSKDINIRTDIGTPNPPINVSVKSKTSTSLYIEWSEPEPPSGPVLNYIVRRSLEKTDQDHITPETFLNVSNLEPYTVYTLKVAAITAAGQGEWSDEKRVRTAIGIPDPPTNLAVSSWTNTSLFIEWDEPETSKGPILEYTVRCIEESNTSDRFYNITDLKPFTIYNISVAATTEVGRGNWSAEETARTDIGTPYVPTALETVSVFDTSVILQWKPPYPATGPISAYTLQWNGTENKTQELQYTASGLLPFYNYTFRVRAETSAGAGEWSQKLQVETKVGIPKPAVFVGVSSKSPRRALVTWVTSGPYPGPVNYSLQAWQYPGLCSPRKSAVYMVKEVQGTREAKDWDNGYPHLDEVLGLSPFSTYHFLIVLRTSAKDGIESWPSKNLTTPPDAAGRPIDVHADCSISPTEARVSWKPPKEPNGIIRSYDVLYGVKGSWDRKTEYVHLENGPCEGQSHLLRGLRPELTYEIQVRAKVEDVAAAGAIASINGSCTTPAGVPSLGKTTRLQLAQADLDPDRLVLEWTRDSFSERMGQITHYAVLVGRRHSLGNATSGKKVGDVPGWHSFNIGSTDFYQATPLDWNPFEQGEDPLQCKGTAILRCWLGAQSRCSENITYCNGPLEPDSIYEMKIRGFTRGGFAETQPIWARTGSVPHSASAIAALTISMIFLVFGMAGLYIKRKIILDKVRARFKPKEEVKPLAVEMDEKWEPKPIPVKNFAERVKILMSDSHLKFSMEFETLKKSSPQFPCSDAEMEENRSKNRWMNVFPFDHSRVKLLPLCDEPGSDYINANYIPGFSSRREYIASQGPLPHTVDDFWRMLWEQSVGIVVMLTQCVERGKKKCEQYWPDESHSYGDLKVYTVSETKQPSHILRLFRVQLGSHERYIKQLHFVCWPDFGCPEKPEDLNIFVTTVRDHMPQITGPILVHCSAGVGRTGTFITVDRLSQQLMVMRLDTQLDVYGTVLELRNHRINMVQTEDQYIYIHLCILQLIRKLLPYKEDLGFDYSMTKI